MALNKRFITYKCNKCQRTKDYEDNTLLPFINLCTITKNCDGRLAPFATKDVRNILATEPVNGLEDWTNNTNSLQIPKDEYFNLTTNKNQALTIGVKGVITIDSFHITLASQSDSTASFVEYDYNKTSAFNSVLGTDSTTSAKVLRFTRQDTVKVYANGVLLEEQIDYVLTYDGDNGYGVAFVVTRNTTTLVKIVVFKSVPILLSDSILFERNSAKTFSDNTETAWSNINNIIIDGETYTLFTCNNITKIPANALLNIYPSNNQIQGLEISDLTSFIFLLAYSPFTVIDRCLVSYIPFSNLSSSNNHIKRFVSASKSEINITANSFKSSNTPFVLSSISDSIKEYITIDSSGVTNQTLFPQSTTIIGPI